jgi:adenylate cyclase
MTTSKSTTDDFSRPSIAKELNFQFKAKRVWAAGFLLTVVLCLGLQLSHGLQKLDNVFFDLQASVLRAFYPRTVDHEVVIVGIDEASTRAFEEPLILWHRHIADFLHVAKDAEATVIGLDVVLPDRSMNRFLPEHDEMLMGAMLNIRRSVPLEIAITIDEAGNSRPIHPAFMAAAGEAGAGLAIFPRDSDQTVRRFDEHLATDGTEVPTFAGNIARLLGITPGSGYIDYSIGGKFSYLPLHELLKQAQAGNSAMLKSALQDKVVLLGAVLPGVDRVVQPVSLAAWESDRLAPGVLIQAQALRTILNGGLLKPVGLSIMVLLIVAAALFWFMLLRPVIAGGGLLVLFVGLFGAALLFQVNGSIFPFAAIASSLTISIAGRQVAETYFRLAERRRLKLAFSGYVSPAVMQEIVKGSLNPSTKGSRVEVCALFADIRGYTTISEHMAPEDVIAFLNRYYEGVVKAIHDQGGAVISFMGDGIMAVFGAPNALENPCVAALSASRDILSSVDRLNASSEARVSPPIKIGIGLHVGIAVMGHVGASDRYEYSAIGDVINTASRLEGLTKEVGFPIVCSRAVFEKAGSPGNFNALGEKAIKGRSNIEVFGINAT